MAAPGIGMHEARAAILVVFAHPYPRNSRACAAHLAALEGLEATEVRSLYDRYPDFDIDAVAEQEALSRAGLVVLLHPLYWYGAPGLLKHWFDTVLVKGFAFGDGSHALAGKDCLWAVTAGGDEKAFSPGGRHAHPFADFVAPMEQTARYCAMNWLPPHVVYDAPGISAEALAASAAAFRARLEAWRQARAQEAR
jgi:glutathione-regulated potassium-efflux system ancillary protein KefF